jgi:Mg2+ and Co2+ transporter CorA
VDTEPPTISAEQAERYRTEEHDVLARLQRSIRYYSTRIKLARAGNYTVGLITLVCSVLAPMAVITTKAHPVVPA